MKSSTFWKVLGTLVALCAAAAAVCWLMRSKKDKCCPFHGKKAEPIIPEDISEEEDPQTTPCEEFSDGTAAEDSEEG